jgi:hypothetical protein
VPSLLPSQAPDLGTLRDVYTGFPVLELIEHAINPNRSSQLCA